MKHEDMPAVRGEETLISFMKGFNVEFTCNCGQRKTFRNGQLRGKQAICNGNTIKLVKREEI